MKRSQWFSWVIVLASSAALMGSALAGPARGKGLGRGGDRGRDRSFPPERMVEDLDLSKDQISSLKKLHEKHRKEADQNREKAKELRQALRTAMENDTPDPELWKHFEAVESEKQAASKMRFGHLLEIRKILTADQRKKFRGMMGEGMGPRDGDGPPPFGGPPPEGSPPEED